VPRDGLIGDEGERKIAAAIASGRIPPSRAAFWRQQAKEGASLDVLATLQPVLASDGSALSIPAGDDGEAVYREMFSTVEESRRAADRQLAASVAAAAGPATDKEVFEAIFGKGTWE
jgi:hypothetical protein